MGFLERALGWFAGQGVTVERVMTDNGSAYRSHAFRSAVTAAGLKHKRVFGPGGGALARRFARRVLVFDEVRSLPQNLPIARPARRAKAAISASVRAHSWPIDGTAFHYFPP